VAEPTDKHPHCKHHSLQNHQRHRCRTGMQPGAGIVNELRQRPANVPYGKRRVGAGVSEVRRTVPRQQVHHQTNEKIHANRAEPNQASDCLRLQRSWQSIHFGPPSRTYKLSGRGCRAQLVDSWQTVRGCRGPLQRLIRPSLDHTLDFDRVLLITGEFWKKQPNARHNVLFRFEHAQHLLGMRTAFRGEAPEHLNVDHLALVRCNPAELGFRKRALALARSPPAVHSGVKPRPEQQDKPGEAADNWDQLRLPRSIDMCSPSRGPGARFPGDHFPGIVACGNKTSVRRVSQ